MAKARFTTEVAPSKVVSIMRRRKVSKSLLDPIAEDEREHQLAYGSDHHHHNQTAKSSVAWTKRPQEREHGGGFMRELGKSFSNAHGQHGGSWEQSSRQGYRRRAVYA